MISTKYCLSTLAIGSPYRLAAQRLAQQVQNSGIDLVIATDVPQDFQKYSNVIARKIRRRSIFYVYNDKRLAISMALENHECTVFVDADSQIIDPLPKELNVSPGLTAETPTKSLEECLIKYYPHNAEKFFELANKLNINVSQAKWVCENLMIIRKDQGRESEFLEAWELSDRWLGLRKVFQGDGSFIGLAAAKAGWKIHDNLELSNLRKLIIHEGRNSLKITARDNSHRDKILFKINNKIGLYWRILIAYIITFKQSIFTKKF
ncbi:hypothetical protein [Aphanothece sacrum]|uniref:Uncharacterized protein n=1 Tax=Aphanothece sacrum FPU1 TaxID=1920663 RepID=A0A401ILN2_APHSA|nr:hypothetical protein [Aphanothece sacrum]GBF82174.1 hypothetical protein AsFPU1_3602 [Aphanothece sacrum FPU1]GBF87288.1 hypothetical protein AsFPU3_4370 [Aphanothece sacrum FPU3]